MLTGSERTWCTIKHLTTRRLYLILKIRLGKFTVCEARARRRRRVSRDYVALSVRRWVAWRQ
jgi:hypothetical protein